MLAAVVALAAQAAGVSTAVDVTGLGVAGVAVAIALAGWRHEAQRADRAQEQLLEVTRSSITSTAEAVGALHSTTTALDRLTDEVRSR